MYLFWIFLGSADNCVISGLDRWQKLANLAQKTCLIYFFSYLVYTLLPKDNFLTLKAPITTAADNKF